MDIVDDAAVAVVDVVEFLMDWTESQRLFFLFACLNLAPLDLGHPWASVRRSTAGAFAHLRCKFGEAEVQLTRAMALLDYEPSPPPHNRTSDHSRGGLACDL